MTLLAGCIYIPSSYTEQGNGKPRPESIIGKDEGSPIVLGRTKIDEALPRVLEQVTGLEKFNPMSLSLSSLMASQPFAAFTDWRFWSVNVERRQVAVPYRLKTGWLVYPFAVTPKTNSRLLVLTSDAHGVVIADETIEPGDLAKHGLTPVSRDPSQLMGMFNSVMRGKLNEAGFDLPAALLPPPARQEPQP